MLEREFHEVIDAKVFQSEVKANKYREKREKENNEFYRSKVDKERYKHIIGLNFDIEEHEIIHDDLKEV